MGIFFAQTGINTQLTDLFIQAGILALLSYLRLVIWPRESRRSGFHLTFGGKGRAAKDAREEIDIQQTTFLQSAQIKLQVLRSQGKKNSS